MRLLRVRIKGKMAHFRKVYSNSTSLSYYFPPRTTVLGIMAAALGMERDSYYEKLNWYDVGVAALTPLRKLVTGEDVLDTDQVSVTKLRGLGGRVPTTKEVVVSSSGDFLGYEIYISPAEPKVEEAFVRPAYPLSLGTAGMLAWTEQEEVVECSELPQGKLKVVGAVPSSLKVDFEPGVQLSVEDIVPREFKEGRRPGVTRNYFFSVSASPYTVQLGSPLKGAVCEGRGIVFL